MATKNKIEEYIRKFLIPYNSHLKVDYIGDYVYNGIEEPIDPPVEQFDWKGGDSYCLKDENDMNTGYQGFTNLYEYNVNTGELTGNSKPNSPGDPDYQPPIYNVANCRLTMWIGDENTAVCEQANEPPTTSDLFFQIEDTDTIDSQIPASDPEGDDLIFTVVDSPAHGTLTLDPNTGDFEYEAELGFEGSVFFRVSVADSTNTVVSQVNVEIDVQTAWRGIDQVCELTYEKLLEGFNAPEGMYHQANVDKLFVCNWNTNTVAVVDGASLETVHTVIVGIRPRMMIPIDNNSIMCAGETGDIRIINVNDYSILASGSVPITYSLGGFSVDAWGGDAMVIGQDNGRMYRINKTTAVGTLFDTLSGSLTYGNNIPFSSNLIVLGTKNSEIHIYNLDTKQIESTTLMPNDGINNFVVNMDFKIVGSSVFLFASNQNGRTIAKYEVNGTNLNLVIHRKLISVLNRTLYNEADDTLYVTEYPDKVYRLDPDTLETYELITLDGFYRGSFVVPDNIRSQRIYVSDYGWPQNPGQLGTTVASIGEGYNTGNAYYLNLEEYIVYSGDPTGVVKPNETGDPDYIAPFEDLDSCPLPVGNDEMSQTFTKQGCAVGEQGSDVTYTVPANRYMAPTKAEANALAQDDIDANGQNYANDNGVCIPITTSWRGIDLTCEKTYESEITGFDAPNFAYHNVSNDKLFVANYGNGTVVVDAATNTVDTVIFPSLSLQRNIVKLPSGNLMIITEYGATQIFNQTTYAAIANGSVSVGYTLGGILVDGWGDVAIFGTNSGTIHRVSPITGNQTTSYSTPEGITYAANIPGRTDVMILGTRNGKVKLFNLTSNTVVQTVTLPNNVSGNNFVSAFAFKQDGGTTYMYCVNNNSKWLFKYEISGTTLTLIDSRSFDSYVDRIMYDENADILFLSEAPLVIWKLNPDNLNTIERLDMVDFKRLLYFAKDEVRANKYYITDHGTPVTDDPGNKIAVIGAGKNTGKAFYITLEEYYDTTGDPTGVTKPNDSGDPDYIAPFSDLDSCPIDEVTVPCGTSTSYNGGQSFPTTHVIQLGSATGNSILSYEAYSIPDKFVVEFDGVEVINTGYRGDSSYQSALDTELTNRGLPTETIQGSGTGTASFNKNSATTFAIVKVYAPLSGTAWTYELSCPE